MAPGPALAAFAPGGDARLHAAPAPRPRPARAQPPEQDGNPGGRQPSGNGFRHPWLSDAARRPHGGHWTGEDGRGHARPRRKAAIRNGL